MSSGDVSVRAVVQRVAEASVSVGEEKVAVIGKGYLVFLAVETGDGPFDAGYIARKIKGLRIFPSLDGTKESDRSIVDLGGEVLIVPQFTLMGDVRKGNRPSYTRSEEPEKARKMIELVRDLLAEEGICVKLGSFRERMRVRLVNDGPYTVLVDSKKIF